MKSKRLLLVCCITFCLTLAASIAGFATSGSTVSSTGKKRSSAKHLTVPASISQIRAGSFSDHGGRSDFSDEIVLHANGKAEHHIRPTPMDQDAGATAEDWHGTLNAYDFQQLATLVRAIDFRHLKNHYGSAEDYPKGYVAVTSGGQEKTVIFPIGSAPPLLWGVTMTVHALAADIAWKNRAGLAVNTGLRGHISFGTRPANYPNPIVVTVADSTSRQVASWQAMGNTFFQFILAPGTYTLVGQAFANKPDGTLKISWHSPAQTVLVSPGTFTPTKVVFTATIK